MCGLAHGRMGENHHRRAVELDPAIREGGDKGLRVTLAGPESKLGKDFFKVAERVAARAKELAAGSESVLEIS